MLSLWRLTVRWREEPRLGAQVYDTTIFGRRAISRPPVEKKARPSVCAVSGSVGGQRVFLNLPTLSKVVVCVVS